jgi:RNA polymerase-binding transcription factor DksA
LREFGRAEAGLEACAEERESELEERAQEEATAHYLNRLNNRSLPAVQEIAAALQRIFDGAYGKCESCYTEIDDARLSTLPATRVCAKFANR